MNDNEKPAGTGSVPPYPIDSELDSPDISGGSSEELAAELEEKLLKMQSSQVSEFTPETLQWLILSLRRLKLKTGEFGATVATIDNLLKSITYLRLVGYSLMVLILLDVAALCVDASLMSPQWEWNFYGSMVERSPVMLLGIGLVFLGRQHARGEAERVWLQLASKLSLVFGLVYLLGLPLSGHNAYRQYNLIHEQHQTNVANLQMQLSSFTGNLLEQGVEDEQYRAQVAQAKSRASSLQAQSHQNYIAQKHQLLKQSISWLPGGLVVGVVFLLLWRKGKWVAECKPELKFLKALRKKLPRVKRRRSRNSKGSKRGRAR